MEQAAVYYVTTSWSIEKIAQLMGMRYQTVRDFLFDRFPKEFNKRRKSLCYRKSKVGEQNHRHGKRPNNYIGLCSDGKGYLTVYKPKWYTGRKGSERVFHHSVVMCEHLGITEIPSGFVVHHIDGNKTNNHISNLALVRLDAHARLHRFEGSETIRKE